LDALVGVTCLRPGKRYEYAPPPKKSRKNATVVEQEPFDPATGVFSDVHLPNYAKAALKYREWLPDTQSDATTAATRTAKAMAGLCFLQQTVYEGTVQATVGRFVVYLWRKSGIGESLQDKVKYMLVPYKSVQRMTAMWDFPAIKGGARADYVRTYNKTEPELRVIAGSTEAKLHVDIRRILELAKPPPKKTVKGEKAVAAEEGEEAEEEDEAGEGDADRMEVAEPEPMPVPRAAVARPPVHLLQALAERFPDMVCILGRTPHNGSDMYHPPRAMKVGASPVPHASHTFCVCACRRNSLPCRPFRRALVSWRRWAPRIAGESRRSWMRSARHAPSPGCAPAA
jgi:hypothetical protein